MLINHDINFVLKHYMLHRSHYQETYMLCCEPKIELTNPTGIVDDLK